MTQRHAGRRTESTLLSYCAFYIFPPNQPTTNPEGVALASILYGMLTGNFALTQTSNAGENDTDLSLSQPPSAHFTVLATTSPADGRYCTFSIASFGSLQMKV